MKGLVRFLKGYKLACFGVDVFMFVQVAAALLVPTLVAGIVNDGIVPGDVNHVWALGLAMLGGRCRLGCGNACRNLRLRLLSRPASLAIWHVHCTRKPIECPISRWGDSASLLSSREARAT